MDRWVKVAEADELPPGNGRRVVAGPLRLALFNDGGEFFAIDDGCPHQGASLGEGLLHGGRVVCPLHSWVFDVRTGISGGTKKKRHVIKIEPRALAAIRLDQGRMRDHLAVRPKERDLFRAMPGMYKDKDELTMKIHPRYRQDAEYLVDEVRAMMR